MTRWSTTSCKPQGAISEGLKFLQKKSMADALVPVVISEDERDQQDESMMKVEVQQAVDSKK